MEQKKKNEDGRIEFPEEKKNVLSDTEVTCYFDPVYLFACNIFIYH